jgi:hypothetical protein
MDMLAESVLTASAAACQGDVNLTATSASLSPAATLQCDAHLALKAARSGPHCGKSSMRRRK